MPGTFITATGTGVGKTLITAALVHQLRAKGIAVTALKPVLSGFDPEDSASDAHIILRALGRAADMAALDAISPWRFRAPLSPDMAARREGRSIAFDALIDYCRQAVAQSPEITLIEGVGGAFVPLDDRHTVADWIAALDLPAIVVAGSYLGTLSHTIATVHAMRERGIAIRAVVVSQSENAPAGLGETRDTLERHLPALRVLTIPRIAGTENVRWQNLPDLTPLAQDLPGRSTS